MKLPILALIVPFAFIFIASCAKDPEYEQWKAEQKAKKAAASSNNPYDAPQAPNLPQAPQDTGYNNPYAAPQTADNAINPPAYDNAPIPNDPIHAPIDNIEPSLPPLDPLPTNPAPIGGGSQHTVVAGDTLWSISKRYNVSVQSIRDANALNGSLIRTGQQLSIPAR